MRSGANRVVHSCIELVELRRLLTSLVPFEETRGTIDFVGEADDYTINLGARDTSLISLAPATPGAFVPKLTVLDPSGNVIEFLYTSSGAAIKFVTSGAGVYTCRITDSDDNATGSYAFTAYASTTAIDGDDDQIPLYPQSGVCITSALAAGDVDVYRLGVASFYEYGIVLNAAEQIDNDPMILSILLVRQDGVVVDASQDPAAIHRIFAESITHLHVYYAVIRNIGTGANGGYAFTYQNTVNSVSIDNSDDNELSTSTTDEHVTTEITRGDMDGATIPEIGYSAVVHVTVTAKPGSSLNPLVELYTAAGQLVASSAGETSAEINYFSPADVDVGYVFVITDRENDSAGAADVIHSVSRPYDIYVGTLRIYGTEGNDTITVKQLANNRLDVNTGIDHVTVSTAGLETISCESRGGNDLVNFVGLPYSTRINTGTGDDSVVGGNGDDTIYPGSGRNTVFGGPGNDMLRGASGRDFLYGDAGNDRLYGNGGNDELIGGSNVDRLYGGLGNDRLDGGASNDYLWGELGDDTLKGGNGRDQMYGMLGDDVFYARDGIIDVVDGGPDQDSGNLDSNDDHTSIEVIV